MKERLRFLRQVGAGLALVAVAAAPLALGAVHRPAVLATLAVALVAFALFVVGSWAAGRPIRGGRFAAVLGVLTAIPLLQVLPLPLKLRNLIDSAGADLLEGSPLAGARWLALTLDPANTLEEIGRAGAALAIFLVAFHVASGRYPRLLVPKVLALSGTVGLVLGLGHRMLGETRIFGLSESAGGIPVGPFVNANHNGEFIELAAFCALAVSRDSQNRLRLGWLALSGVLAAGALSTLSRGAVVAVMAGAAVFLLLRWLRRETAETAPPPLGNRVLALIIALGTLAALALALGVGPVFDEIAGTDLRNHNEKIYLWKDALQIIWHHPAGIGRGAFESVYPVYQTLITHVRFPSVENAVLEMLIETGWPGFLAWLVGLAVMVRQIARWGRRDAMEAALLAGLAAVFAHNIVDFGFDTLGIRLPYVAVLGATLGRMVLPGQRQRHSWVGMSLVAVAGLAVVIGGLGVARTPDYDRALRAASAGAARRAIAIEAAAAHPADYFYPLHQGLNEPLAPDASGRSPKLRSLGRALRLCDICWDPHRATARALWTIGRRLQAIGEWKRAAILEASFGFSSVLDEVANAGATPAELVRFAPDEPALGLQVAWVLARKKARPELAELLDRLRAVGTAPIETWLVEVELATALGDRDGARRILRQAGLAAPGDARVPLGLADVEVSEGNPALARDHARAAVHLDPANVMAQRKWFELSAATQSWPDAEKALEGLGMALGRAGLPMTEVRLGAARMWRQRRHPLRAISELKTTTLIEPNNFGVWFELGQAAEEAGHVVMALDSYRQALRILPTDASTKAALARLEDLKRAAAVEAIQNLGAVPGSP